MITAEEHEELHDETLEIYECVLTMFLNSGQTHADERNFLKATQCLIIVNRGWDPLPSTKVTGKPDGIARRAFSRLHFNENKD